MVITPKVGKKSFPYSSKGKKAAKKAPPKKVSKAREPHARKSKYDTKLQVDATFDQLMGELFKPKKK